MKRTFIKMLPFVAAVLLATSCSKDSNDDNNVAIDPVETQNVASPTESKTISFSITVNKNTLSKASLQEVGLAQVFEEGDYLVIENGENPVTLTMEEGGDKQGTATFSNDKIPADALTKGKTYNVVLKNSNHPNCGKPLTEVKDDATSLKEAFEKYGYLTYPLEYDGESSASIVLVQNTAFIKVDLPFHGAKLSIKYQNGEGVETTEAKFLSGNEILAVPNEATLNSAILDITDKKIDVLTKNAKGTYTVVYNIRNRTTPDDCINGVFSVSQDKQVFFSKSNLRYNNSAWSFTDHQYDYIGDAQGNPNSGSGPRDLFCWGTWLKGAEPMTASSDYATYEWNGKACAIGSDWRNFTYAEMKYLFVDRETKGNTRFVKATITTDDDGNTVQGLLLFPDDWSEDITNANNGTEARSSDLKFSKEEWEEMESAGVVFFPGAGCRKEDGSIQLAGSGVHLWTSTPSESDPTYAYYLDCNDAPYWSLGAFSRYHGFSVRLIREK